MPLSRSPGKHLGRIDEREFHKGEVPDSPPAGRSFIVEYGGSTRIP